MSATATNDETWLLILPKQRQLVPLHPVALTRAQATRNELQQRYADALILDAHSLRRIENLELVGPYGESMGRKLLSRLTSAWRLSVQLSPALPTSLDDLKQTIIDYLPTSAPWYEGEESSARAAPSPESIAEAVRKATTHADLLRALQLPKPEDSLDGL